MGKWEEKKKREKAMFTEVELRVKRKRWGKKGIIKTVYFDTNV